MASRLVICFADLGRQAPKGRTATTKNRSLRSLNTTGPESAKAERQQKLFQQQEQGLMREAVEAVPVTAAQTASGDAVPVTDAQTALGDAVPVTEAIQALPAQATPAAEVVAAQAQSPEDISGKILAAYDDPEPDQQTGDAGLGNAGQPKIEQPNPVSDQQAGDAGLGDAEQPDPQQPDAAAQHIFGQHAADSAPNGNAGPAQHIPGQHAADPASNGNVGAGPPMGANDDAPNDIPMAFGEGNPAAAAPAAAQVPPTAPAGGWRWN